MSRLFLRRIFNDYSAMFASFQFHLCRFTMICPDFFLARLYMDFIIIIIIIIGAFG